MFGMLNVMAALVFQGLLTMKKQFTPIPKKRSTPPECSASLLVLATNCYQIEFITWQCLLWYGRLYHRSQFLQYSYLRQQNQDRN